MGEVVEIAKYAEKPREKITGDALLVTSFAEAKRIFLLHCRAKNLSPRTIPWYEEKLMMFEKYVCERHPALNVNTITPEAIKAFICHLQERENGSFCGKQLSTYTIAGIIRVLKVFFRFLFEEGYLPQNPCEKVKIPKIQKKIIKPLSEEEIQKLLSVPDVKTFTGFRNYLLMLLFLDSGIRLSELINLKIKDVDWERYTLKILGKGNKEREVPFGMRAAKGLIKFIKWRGNVQPTDFVFADRNGQRMKMRRVAKIVEDCGKKAGVEGVHCHKFRHTFALSWIKYGGDTFSLQRILGHTTLDMVRNYVNLAGEDVSAKHRQFGLMDRMEVVRKTQKA